MSWHFLLACKVSAEKSADSLMEFHLYVTNCFSLAALLKAADSFSLTFVILITMCLGACLFGFNLFETLQASWTWMSVSFPRLGILQLLFLQISFSVPFSFSSTSGTPIMWMLCYLLLYQRSLKVSSLFKIFCSICCSVWMSSIALPFSSLICLTTIVICCWTHLVYFSVQL